MLWRRLPWISAMLLAGLLCAAGCNGPRYQKADPAATAAAQATAVCVAHPRPAAELPADPPLSGTLRSQQQALLAFQVAGQVATIAKAEGDAVLAGEVLATLDQRLFTAQRDQAAGALAQAQAQLDLATAGGRPEEIALAQAQVDSAQAVVDNAQAEYDRAVKLFTQGVIPAQALDAATTGLKQAQQALTAAQQQLALARQGAREEERAMARAVVQSAQALLSQAETQLAYATLRAPFGGTISLRQLEVGQVTAAGLPVFEIVNLEQLEAVSEIPEGGLHGLKLGDLAEMAFPALPGVAAQAVIKNITPQADPATRGFAVQLTLLGVSPEVRPGMVALISFTGEHQSAGVAIPRRCLVHDQVFVIENETAQPRAVKVLLDRGDEVLVDGLTLEDTVVVNGQEYLSAGQAVRIVEALALEDLATLEQTE